MQIILRKDYDQLGKTGDIVNVKVGFARNYLIPKGIAFIADDKNLRRIEQERKQLSLQKEKEKQQAEKLASELAKVSCTASVQVGEEEKVKGFRSPSKSKVQYCPEINKKSSGFSTLKVFTS